MMMAYERAAKWEQVSQPLFVMQLCGSVTVGKILLPCVQSDCHMGTAELQCIVMSCTDLSWQPAIHTCMSSQVCTWRPHGCGIINAKESVLFQCEPCFCSGVDTAAVLLQAINLLDKARALGIVPNTIMYNTAMSALGKSGQWEAAERLFSETAEPDSVSHETLIAAYGMAGQAAKAELTFKTMLEAKHTPRDYAYCGLIAAHR